MLAGRGRHVENTLAHIQSGAVLVARFVAPIANGEAARHSLGVDIAGPRAKRERLPISFPIAPLKFSIIPSDGTSARWIALQLRDWL